MQKEQQQNKTINNNKDTKRKYASKITPTMT